MRLLNDVVNSTKSDVNKCIVSIFRALSNDEIEDSINYKGCRCLSFSHFRSFLIRLTAHNISGLLKCSFSMGNEVIDFMITKDNQIESLTELNKYIIYDTLKTGE